MYTCGSSTVPNVGLSDAWEVSKNLPIFTRPNPICLKEDGVICPVRMLDVGLESHYTTITETKDVGTATLWSLWNGSYEGNCTMAWTMILKRRQGLVLHVKA